MRSAWCHTTECSPHPLPRHCYGAVSAGQCSCPASSAKSIVQSERYIRTLCTGGHPPGSHHLKPQPGPWGAWKCYKQNANRDISAGHGTPTSEWARGGWGLGFSMLSSPGCTQPHCTGTHGGHAEGHKGTPGGHQGESGQPRGPSGPPQCEQSRGASPHRLVPGRRHHHAGFYGNSEPRLPLLPLLCNSTAGQAPDPTAPHGTAWHHTAPHGTPAPHPSPPASCRHTARPCDPTSPQPHGANTARLVVVEHSCTTGHPHCPTAPTCQHQDSAPQDLAGCPSHPSAPSQCNDSTRAEP